MVVLLWIPACAGINRKRRRYKQKRAEESPVRISTVTTKHGSENRLLLARSGLRPDTHGRLAED